jgi:hypothetical protein
MRRNPSSRSALGVHGVLAIGLPAALMMMVAVSASAASLCDHPYFPLSTTLKRKYQTSYRTGMPPFTHIDSITDITDTGFTQKLELATATFERPWTCTADGLVNSEPGNLSAEVRMKTEKSSGVTLVTADRLKPGAAWQRHYEMRGTMPVLEGSEVWGTLDLHFEVVGSSPITVPAGTFDAVQIRFVQVQKFTMKHEKNESPIHSVLKGTLWYVKDVGLAKTEIETAAVTELLTFQKEPARRPTYGP